MTTEEITCETRQKNSIVLWHGDLYSSRVYASCEDRTDEVAYAICKKINEKPHTYMDAIYVLKDSGYID